MIRIVIVEDNKTIRDGLSLLMNATDGLKCVAKYKDCESMLLEVKQNEPDLILMDIGLPGMSGIEGTKKAKEICNRCPVKEPCLEQALERGERFGIWGGKSERERRAIRKERKMAPLPLNEDYDD